MNNITKKALRKALRQEGSRALGIFKNQYWQNFTNTNFLKILLPYCPVLDLLHARGVSPAALCACRLNPLAIRISSPLRKQFTELFPSAECKSASILVPSKAFTMAEILLSLTIIGVVAAITLPSLTGNINERTWNTQRKALYARMSQAIAMLPAMNGYGQYQGNWASDSVTTTVDTAAETFVTQGLAKVMKINNICDNSHFEDCGLPDKYTKFQASSKSDFPKRLSELIPYFVTLPPSTTPQTGFLNPQKNVDTKAVGIETQNGESIAVFYNPQCVAREVEFTQHNDAWGDGKNIYPYFCVAFLFDLNGRKGPNVMGKDIWRIIALYSSDTSVVMIEPDKITKYKSDLLYAEAQEYCSSLDARLANVDEGITGLLAGFTTFGWLNGDTGDNGKAYLLLPSGALIKIEKNGARNSARCIKH